MVQPWGLDQLVQGGGVQLSQFDQWWVAQRGERPELLIVSGIHGDETGSVPVLSACLAQLLPHLPDFVFIPILSLEAAKSGTRASEAGVDFNRSFNAPQVSAETAMVKQLIQQLVQTSGQPFLRLLSFHEDAHQINTAYAYVCSPETGRVLQWQKAMQQAGLQLLTGIDDDGDPYLGCEFVQGIWQYQHDALLSATFEDWVIQSQLAKEAWTLEVPGLAETAVKRKMIRACLRSLRGGGRNFSD